MSSHLLFDRRIYGAEDGKDPLESSSWQSLAAAARPVASIVVVQIVHQLLLETE